MQSIQLAPMQWAALPDISEVPPLDESDTACLDEIRTVLQKYKAIGRFGVHLVHKHFDVSADEVLVEYSDADARTLHCRVEKRQDDQPDPAHKRIETMWSFVGEGAARVCDQQCVYNQGHANRHYRRNGAEA